MRKPSTGKVVCTHLGLVLFCFATLYPVLWVVKMALTPSQAFSLSANPFPDQFSLDNFRELIFARDMEGHWLFAYQLWNSTVVAVATTLIGLLPTGEQIGIWAPILLILMRLFQGAGAGAEFAGAMTMASESAPSTNRAWTAGFPGASVYVGMALATTAFAIITAVMPLEQFQAWGWRIPFIASIVIVAFALYFRLRVKETAAFETAEREGTVQRAPLAEAIRTHWRYLLAGMALFVFILPWVYVVQTWSISYTTGTLSVDATHALIGVVVAV